MRQAVELEREREYLIEGALLVSQASEPGPAHRRLHRVSSQRTAVVVRMLLLTQGPAVAGPAYVCKPI
jgi:hypothetical protein